ncbi:MAG: hypothetical protein ACI9VR_004255 [Cognaticolwellia sp.]
MSQSILCTEPGGRPLIASVELESGENFSIYVIEDADPAGSILRATILRKGTNTPPPGSLLLFEATLVGTGGNSAIRTVLVNSQITVEMIRPDARSRVTSNIEIPSPSRFEINFGDLRTISFTLEAPSASGGKGAKSMVGGGGTRRSSALAVGGSSSYMIPSIVATLRVPQMAVLKWLTAQAQKLGLSPWMIGSLVAVLFTLGSSIAVAGWSYMKSKDAEEETAAAIADMESAADARDSALQAEAQCLVERRDLVEALGDVQKERELLAEAALALTATRILAAEKGGGRYSSEEAIGFDRIDDMKEKVVAVISSLRGEAKTATFCLQQDEQLGNDLPRYVLLWHPDTKLVCPTEYATVENGIAAMGRWALSDRAAREFGVQEEATSSPDTPGDGISNLLSDPRMRDRWSANAYTQGLRAVQEGVLTAPTGDRPAVAPGQAHLWMLTVWDQYNKMSSPVGGVMNTSAEQCAQSLVMEQLNFSGPAEPGQPILPDIVKVANGELKIEPTPTAGCPWPSERSMEDSAQAALRAVSHMAKVNGSADGSADSN